MTVFVFFVFFKREIKRELQLFWILIKCTLFTTIHIECKKKALIIA
jgi:hypothetical protein